MSIELIHGDCIEVMRSMPDRSVDLVFGSPPYVDARLYLERGQNLGISRDCQAWVDWMLAVTTEAHRICRGPVFWVCAGVTRDRNYQPACEGLAWEWWKRGGDCQLYRPCVFHRGGIPGSGGNDYLRSDWEYVLCFKHAGKLAWSDNTACGHPPKWAPGGEMSHRSSDGTRRNQWGSTEKGMRARQRNGAKQKLIGRPSHVITTKSGTATSGRKNGDNQTVPGHCTPPVLANPGNVISLNVGGGLMGSPLCHENEAPFPEYLARFFVLSFCSPGGKVLDPFLGSGTTLAVAKRWGRKGIGIDIRQSQIELARKRLDLETAMMFT